jgi:GNAT superfamily N-acetyltransferase
MSLSFWSSLISNSSPLCKNANSQIRDSLCSNPKSPTGLAAKVVKSAEDAARVQKFLEIHFGDPPKSPILRANLSPTDIILFVSDQSDQIVGTVRYTYAGLFEDVPIHVVDCFCIISEWRKRGLGSYLLTTLHNETMRRGLHYSVFLKESAPIYALKQPIYSSSYVFCYSPQINEIRANILTLRHDQALILIQNYKEIHPDTFVICPISPNKQTYWRLWRQDHHSILASFHNSYQIHPNTHTSIGWCTGWLESTAKASDKIRDMAIQDMISTLPFEWIWADKAWIQPINAVNWKADGPFHWYTYQWQPTICPNGSYIFHV